MYNFFVDSDNRRGDRYVISGGDYNHIKNVLRMKPGDSFLVSDGGKSSLCVIERIASDSLTALVTQDDYKNTELPVKIYLFQGLPKSDKMELIIQKAVELGAYEIIPTQMKRCVVRLEEKRKQSKTMRWQAISESAAKQSKRNIIPAVKTPVTFKEAAEYAKSLDLVLVPYENDRSMQSTAQSLNEIKKGMSVGIFIGPEGGFEREEIERIQSAGAKTVSLGERILRAETAAITAVGMCMLYAEMKLRGEEEA